MLQIYKKPLNRQTIWQKNKPFVLFCPLLFVTLALPRSTLAALIRVQRVLRTYYALRKAQIDLAFHSFFRNFAAYTTKNNLTSATIWRTPAISLQKND